MSNLLEIDIDEAARWMMTTADASFRQFQHRMEIFLRDIGVDPNALTDQRRAELVSILRAMDAHRIEQMKHWMGLAMDRVNTTLPKPFLLTKEEYAAFQKVPTAASLISSISDEFHDPEPEL